MCVVVRCARQRLGVYIVTAGAPAELSSLSQEVDGEHVFVYSRLQNLSL